MSVSVSVLFTVIICNVVLQKADIYAFGLIMWMFEMEDTPFKHKAHDLSLAQSICQGARPELSPWAPEFYRSAYKKCVDPDPDKRPSADQLAFYINQWNQDRDGEYIPALERARNMLK